MANFANADVLDNGIAYIKANCTQMLAVISYTFGDSYATVTTPANIIAAVTMTPADFTLASSGNNRSLTVLAGKQDASANNTGNPSHIAFVDVTNSKVLWVCAETSAVGVSAGQPVNFPGPVYTSIQPA